MSYFAKTSWYINNNGYACLKIAYLLKNMYKTNIYIMNGKSCWQALNMKGKMTRSRRGCLVLPQIK